MNREPSTRGEAAHSKLTPGRTLGPYEIVEQIGSGGMGAVYRGRDTRLNRSVAIKVLAEELTAQPKLRDRLTREARSISALSHPNICALYDVGHEDGIDYLVMEFLEGQSLAQRLEEGPLPVRQALRIGAEIAGALDAAHRAGVIHRDLKPANVMLTRSGARLVDFGLAKALEKESDPQAPTAAAPLTEPGTVVGTLQYMSPEQIGGQQLDARSDIFSFGAMLYEMVTGRRAFEAQSRMSVISAILNDTPALDAVPESIRRIVRKCVEKNPDDRWQSAADLRDELVWIGSSSETTSAVRPAAPRVWPWIAAAATALAVAIVVAAVSFRRAPQQIAEQQFRFGVTPPARTYFTQRATNGEIAVSPDGRFIAFAALQGGQRSLYVRPLNDLTARELPGTTGAMSPFWSPDSRWIGFFSGAVMKKIALEGGPAQTICPAVGGSGSWSKQGTILFAEWGPDVSEYIQSVSANGGKVTAVTSESGWHFWPSLLEDGRHFLFTVNYGKGPTPGLYLASLDGGKPVLLVAHARRGESAASGWIFYVRDDALVKQKLDVSAGRVTGEAMTVAEHVFNFLPTGNANFSISRDGSVVAYQRLPLETRLVWRDLDGHETGHVKTPLPLRKFRLSPDGHRIAIDEFESTTGVSNIWIDDVDRDVITRVTSRAFGAFSPIWLPNGHELAIADVSPEHVSEPPQLAIVSLSSGVIRSLVVNDGVARPTGSTPDGKYLIYTIDRGHGKDIELFSTSGDGKKTPLQASQFNEGNGTLDATGRWLAFESDDSGQPEVYVRAMGGEGEKTRVSTDGGTEPRWSHNGRELFYLASDGMLMIVPMTTSGAIAVGKPTQLFPITSAGMMELEEVGLSHYDIAPDDLHILAREIPGGRDEAPVVVICGASAPR